MKVNIEEVYELMQQKSIASSILYEPKLVYSAKKKLKVHGMGCKRAEQKDWEFK